MNAFFKSSALSTFNNAAHFICNTLSKVIESEGSNLVSGPNGSPTPGNAFLKWLLQAQQITWVTITPTNAESNKFAEFPPDDGLVNSFDPEDRKFVAVANAHPDKPPILESADSKWLGWENQLKAHGINVEMICRRELEEIHKRKTNHLQ